MSNISIPYYKNTLDFYYSAQDISTENLIWNRYIASRGYDSNNPPEPTDAIKRDFQSFVSFYRSQGITPTDTGESVPSSDDDFYNTYLKAFYGNCSENVQKDIWNSFLKNNNLSHPSDSPSLRTLFANYIKNLQQQAISLAAATSLTPQEEMRRTAVYDVLGALKKYLNATQDLLANQGALLLLYANWQQEYTKMMQKIPVLTGGGLPGAIKLGVNSNNQLTDAASYTFGYGNISLQDVVNWGYSEALKNPGEVITFGDSTKGMGAYTFQVIEPDAQHKSVKIGFAAPQFPNTTFEETVLIKDPDAKNPVTNKAPLDLDLAAADTAIGQKFIQMLGSKVDFTTVMAKPYLPDVGNWLVDQISKKENQAVFLPSTDYFGVYSEWGPSFIYTNKNIESDPTKQVEITVGTSVFKGQGNVNDYCSISIKVGTAEPVLKDFIFGHAQNTFDYKNHLIPEAREYLLNYLSEHSDTLSPLLSGMGPIALQGTHLGTLAIGPSFLTHDDKPRTLNPSLELEQKDTQARGEMQAMLTQYAQTIQGTRDLIGSLASRQQSALNQAKESLNQQADIFTSILESIDAVMKAICKK